jgi:hypothetical protein
MPGADATSAHGRLMLTVLGGLTEFERELIRARMSEGRKSEVCLSRQKMSLLGQNAKFLFTLACQLPPGADMPLNWLRTLLLCS